MRPTAARELLQAGVDWSVIALWLGHETMETTLTYLHAHLELKESALAKLKPYERAKAERFSTNRSASGIPERDLGIRNMPSATTGLRPKRRRSTL
ncbi:hypothetical protein [Mesorhizobium sp.]|uniref:hypothetical protein n=1 Tax=Mesorhizobium sp. TaxID=1871066 RepID=UPI0025FA761A|nr:hypothetical protein [Mesorhizobium sp.]